MASIKGSSAEMNGWGIDNDTGALRDALPSDAWPADRPLRVAVTISGGNPDPAQLEAQRA